MAENVKQRKKTTSKAKTSRARKKTGAKAELPEIPEICSKSILTRLMRRSHGVDEATAVARGELGKEVSEAVARQNLHPWAFRIAKRLSRMTEQGRAEAWYQLRHYVELLDIAQDDLFRPRRKRQETDEPLPAIAEEHADNRAEPMPGDVGPMLHQLQ